MLLLLLLFLALLMSLPLLLLLLLWLLLLLLLLLSDRVVSFCCTRQVQQNVEFLVDESLRLGAHPDDRDCLTDMTMLMYACKAGASGVGDADAAARVGLRILNTPQFRRFWFFVRSLFTHKAVSHIF